MCYNNIGVAYIIHNKGEVVLRREKFLNRPVNRREEKGDGQTSEAEQRRMRAHPEFLGSHFPRPRERTGNSDDPSMADLELIQRTLYAG